VPRFGLDRPLDPLLPDAYVELEFYNEYFIPTPDGKTIEVWGFMNPATGIKKFPSETIRVREGQIFHGMVKQHFGPHTVHWHGIEPTSANDGVGKLSFDVDSEYTYQWLAAEAGTYFYHCHRNTTLHFEMGMYGALIIDPPQGQGFVRRMDEIIPYDHERIWVADEMDPAWHVKDKSAGLNSTIEIGPERVPWSDEDVGLNDFMPEYFFITGVASDQTETDERIVVNAKVGETILLRIICAGYTYQTWTLGIDAECVAMDGRTMGQNYSPGAHCPYSYPYVYPAYTPIELTSARRLDLLVRPTQAGDYPVLVETRHINASRYPDVLGSCATWIHVAPQVDEEI
jgi:FtsP/CotA-like multicopper oxidase with cupredoxin domain